MRTIRAGLAAAALGAAACGPGGGDQAGAAAEDVFPAAQEAPVTDPNGRTGTLLVVNKGDDSVWLLDAADGRRIAALPTGREPHEVAVSRDGRRAVVADYGGPRAGNTLTVIDLPGKRVERTVDLGEHLRPHGMAWLPDGRRVVVTSEVRRAVVVVDVDAGAVLGAVSTGEEGTHMLALSADGGRVYTTNVGSGTVSAIDLATMTLVGTGRAGAGPEGFDLSPDGRELWVGNRGDHTVSVLDAATLREVARLPAPRLPFRVDFTPDGARAVVATPQSGTLRVYDVPGRALAAAVEMRFDAPSATGPRPRMDGPGAPLGVVVSADGSHAFAANANAPVVTVVDLRRGEIVAYFATGRGPDGIAYSPVSVD